MNSLSLIIWLNMVGVLIELSNGMHPLVTLKNSKMFTADSVIEFAHNNTYLLPPYFSELEFECNSSYPTKWLFSTNPYLDDNLREIPKVVKTRLPVNDSIENFRKGPFIFSSTVLLRFKKTENIPNLTCEELPKKILHTKVLVSEPSYSSPNFVLKIQTGTTDKSKRNASTDTDRMRFGRNPYCNLSIHISTFQKKYACRSTDISDGRPILSRIIECYNPDECHSIYRKNPDCDETEEIKTMEDPCVNKEKDCITFVPNLKPGVIRCFDGILDLAVKYQLQIDGREIVLDPLKNEMKGSEPLIITSMEETIYYDGMPYIFVCNASMYTYTHGIQWFLQKDHSPDSPEPIDLRKIQGADEKRNEVDQFYTSTVRVIFNRNDSERQLLTCAAPIWNKEKKVAHKTVNVTVLESYQPKNVNIHHNKVKKTLLCKVSAQPLANVTWTWKLKDANNINTVVENVSSVKEEDNMCELYVGDLPSTEVTYTCRATNFKGTSMATITLLRVGSNDSIVLWGVGIGLFILALSTLLVIYKIKKQKQQGLSDADIEEFEQGASSNTSNNNPILLPYNVKFEIEKESLTMDDGILGSGFFGTVRKGKHGTTVVAIKTVKRSADVMHFKALLSELKIMCHIGNHPHLVNLVGACTKNIRKQELYIVVEFCSNGNLMKLLRNSRNTFVNHYMAGKVRQSAVIYVNAEGKKLSTKDLVKWSAEIASGMEFLSSNNVIHGDLATRNVLISESMTAKLCDFGLSKQLCDYTVYVQKPQKPLPLKWMALESLRDLEFSLESDIWSYGVTIWEVFSLGQSPYPGLQWDYNSWNLLEGGYRMLKPEFCNDAIYKLMLQCWDKNPKHRKPFGQLRIAFENELNKVLITTGSEGLNYRTSVL